MIVFVSPQQLSNVLSILANKGIIFHKLTEKEGTKPEKRFSNKSEREHIISKFKSKDYQVIVAIKCMDEGIDIPTADVGILMASSTNPREYIQRVGRIIRQSLINCLQVFMIYVWILSAPWMLKVPNWNAK